MKHSAAAASLVAQERLAEILAQIPWPVWESIVRREPEWENMIGFLPSYGFGPFAALMVAAGLNDYYLTGKAEIAYWPRLQSLLIPSPVPRSPGELLDRLARFYHEERDQLRKVKTLQTYLTSELAGKLWKDSAQTVAAQFPELRRDLASTLAQSDEDKQIVFAMKCLGLSLMMAGVNDFDSTFLPLPAGSRLRKLSKKLNFICAGQDATRELWSEIFALIRKRHNQLSMIHLDSLLWQIAPLDGAKLRAYFEALGVRPTGVRLADLLSAQT